MQYVKAVTVLSSIKYMNERFGKDALSEALSELSDADKFIINDPKLIGSRLIPLDTYLSYLQLIIKNLNQGDDSIMDDVGAHDANRELNGVYRAFLKIASPEFVIKQSGVIYNTYYKSDNAGMKTSVKRISKNKFVASAHGLEAKYGLIELKIIAWYRKALELSGAKDINIIRTVTLAENKGYFEAQVDWK